MITMTDNGLRQLELAFAPTDEELVEDLAARRRIAAMLAEIDQEREIRRAIHDQDPFKKGVPRPPEWHRSVARERRLHALILATLAARGDDDDATEKEDWLREIESEVRPSTEAQEC